MQRFVFYISLLFIKIIGFLPFPLLYILADFFAFLLQNVLQYRKKVVEANLAKVFPAYSVETRKKIMRNFYRHLADITLESIKGFNMSAKALQKRFVLENPNLLNDYFDAQQSIILTSGHLGNWEWATPIFPQVLLHKIIGFYKPIANPYFDRYVHQKRNKVVLASIKKTAYHFEHFQNKCCNYVLIGDQSPSKLDKAIWVDFFGVKTACLHGAEFYAKTYNYPVLFGVVKRQKRGYYTVSFSRITDTPTTEKEGEITQKYMDKVAEAILAQPESWLWSHKRWKHTID
ncbi:MAG: hypothetical protein R2798_00800 [Chitinophagales bacterium]|nr:hypothetical protein [Bacteroidota bacterium]